MGARAIMPEDQELLQEFGGRWEELTRYLEERTEASGVPLSLADAQRMKKILSWVRAKTWGGSEPLLLTTHMLAANLLGQRAASFEVVDMEDEEREEALQELRDVLQRFRANLLGCHLRSFIRACMVTVQILRRLGRFKEGLELAQRELPCIEELAPKFPQYREDVMKYMQLMSTWSFDGLEGSQYPTALKKERIRQAEGFFRKSFAMAEDARLRGAKLFPHVGHMGVMLSKCGAYAEALPYARRALELAPPHLVSSTANLQAETFVQLSRFAEAENVLRRGLNHISHIEKEVDKLNMEATLQRQLAYALAQQGAFEKALPHIHRARELWLVMYRSAKGKLSLDDRNEVSRAWDVGGNILEGLGLLDKAKDWDLELKELVDCINLSSKRRALCALHAGGHLEEAQVTAHQFLDVLLVPEEPWTFYRLPSRSEIVMFETIADALATSTSPKSLALARNVRADVAESKAILEALREAVLTATREEAAAAARKAREDAEAWLSPALASRTGKKGKQQGKKAKQKGKGKGKGKGGSKGNKSQSRHRDEEGVHRSGGEGRGGAAEGGEGRESHAEEEEEEEAYEGVECPAPPSDAEGGDEECAICFLDLEEDDKAEVVLECGHRFHGACVELWVNNCCVKGLQVTCPMCRADIRC